MSNDTRSRPMTTETIHTCSYSCERPGCIRAQRDELAARLEALAAAQRPAAPSETVNVIGMPEFDSLLDHIYEYGTAADGVIERANAFARAVIARYAPQQSAAVAAIQFALNNPEGMTFLRLWNEGEFDTLRREWPDAPSEVYVGADPLATKHQETTT